MKPVCLLPLLLSLHFHYVHSINKEIFMKALLKLRMEKGITDDDLVYDKELEVFGKENASLEDMQKNWDDVVEFFTGLGQCEILKGEAKEKIYENTKYGQEFYKDMINKIDQAFTHLLYDPRYGKVAAIFFDNGTKKTPFVIIFGGGQRLEDYVAKHICFLRSEVMQFVDELAPEANTLLNKVAKWTTAGEQISKELIVVNLKIENHDKQSIAFKIMKTLDSLFEQRQPNTTKDKFLSPNAQRLGAYINKHESRELVIVIEYIETGNLVDELWTFLKAKIGLQAAEYAVHATRPHEKLNKIAECIASGYGVQNRSNNPSMELAKKCGFDPNMFHGIFAQNLLQAEDYKKDNFQYHNISMAVNNMYALSLFKEREEALALYDPQNIGFGIGFALVEDESRSYYYWNVFAIFQYMGKAQ